MACQEAPRRNLLYVLELGLASEAELEELDAAARAYLDDPDTVVITHLFSVVSVRKPAGSGTEPPTAGNPGQRSWSAPSC